MPLSDKDMDRIVSTIMALDQAQREVDRANAKRRREKVLSWMPRVTIPALADQPDKDSTPFD